MRKVLSMSDLGQSFSTEPSSAGSGEHDLGSAGGATVQVTAGELLRQAREAAGLHIAALAVSLKVPVKKLEALEADRFDLLPDAVFVRALASSVCRTLKIDTSPVLQRLPQTNSPKLTYQSVRLNTPFRAPSDGPGPSIWTQISRPAVLAGLLLLLGALILILLPAMKTSVGETSSDAVSATPSNEPAKMASPVAPVFVADTVSTEVAKLSTTASDLSSPAMTSSSALLSVQSPTPTTAASTQPTSLTTAVRPQVLAAPAAMASAALPMSSTGIVVFRAKGESWVEVTDAKGLVVLRRILSAGEVVGASGVLPLAAVVGRVDATQVEIRGKAFDLSAFAKDNVARFEVK